MTEVPFFEKDSRILHTLPGQCTKGDICSNIQFDEVRKLTEPTPDDHETWHHFMRRKLQERAELTLLWHTLEPWEVFDWKARWTLVSHELDIASLNIAIRYGEVDLEV